MSQNNFDSFLKTVSEDVFAFVIATTLAQKSSFKKNATFFAYFALLYLCVRRMQLFDWPTA
jgi:hypothetical protein